MESTSARRAASRSPCQENAAATATAVTCPKRPRMLGAPSTPTRGKRRLDRARRLRVPHSLTDLAGLNVSAEDFLAAVLETAAQPIWVVDPDGVIRFANPAAIAALGYDSADELFGRDSHETIHYRHPDGTPVSGRGVPDAAAAGDGRDGPQRSGLVLPARRLDVPRLLRLGADRDAGGPWRRRGLHRHRGPPARRADAARPRRGACSA